MLDLVLAQGKLTVVATIYDCVPGLAPGLRTALAVFNDVIVREAVRRSVQLLDLRLGCTEPADYAACLPIEPSAQGAAKIAAAIAALVAPASGQALESHGNQRTVIYTAAPIS